MLNLKFVLDNEEKVRQGLKNRNFDLKLFEKLIEVGNKRGTYMHKAQLKKSELSKFSKEFGQFKNDPEKLAKIKKEIEDVKKDLETLEKKASSYDEEVEKLLLAIPNIPLDIVPIGKDENSNQVIKCHDKLGRGLIAGVLPHYEIAKKLDIIDLERAVKLSGSRFVLYKGLGAMLTRALQNFMLDQHLKRGYTEFATPVLVKPEMLYGTGQLPKFKEDLFALEGLQHYLIPTAEVTLTNIYNNEIVDLTQPICLTAFTECFRSEAGSGGKDTKGIIRNHQFKKVELVKIVSEKDAWNEYEKTVEDAKNILELLGIPYREMKLCTGDLGFSSMHTIDLELWIPSEIKYREVSSISYFGDFQARRAMIRYKNEKGENQYAHTINGSGLAIDRLVASILENYQNKDGSISIPEKLIPYMNGIDKIK
ncbi:serine--tRNA ligase [Mycoplasmopsis hyopharyngis]|uniref:serine--tRNA ligase n=1 Tax=Mycoplasmopsis hyopharyngis TaxID=29558 RepID=UPI00387372E1